MRLLLILPLVFAAGCVQWNDQCQPLVDNPQKRVAFVAKGSEIWIDRANARHANNAIGQAATDAFVWIFKDSDAPVQLAVMNGGAIRAEGLCVTRNILKEGPLSTGVLHEVLLFENIVQAVDLSEQEVVDMFEHSAERLFASSASISSPAGSFLQVSQEVTMDVDCSKTAGGRVTNLKIGGQLVQRPGRTFPGVKYRVALPAFVLGGGDAYTMLAGKGSDPARNPKQANRFGGVDSHITAAYLEQSTYNQTVEQGLKAQPRINFINCAAPVRPSSP